MRNESYAAGALIFEKACYCKGMCGVECNYLKKEEALPTATLRTFAFILAKSLYFGTFDLTFATLLFFV